MVSNKFKFSPHKAYQHTKDTIVETINIDKIKTDNKYLRLNGNVDKLKKSIETVGIINPLIINTENMLVAGGRRYTALKELGFKDVPVVIVKKGKLHDELISIDENLVRKDLTKIEMEHSLRRAKEIYEELYPEEDDALEIQENTNDDGSQKVSKFIAETSEKTGLSQKVITNAINRDLNASKKVKSARVNGELSSSQTDELIKLSKKDQDELIEVIKNKPVKEIKEIVKTAKDSGVSKAIAIALTKKQLNNEYKKLEESLLKVKKLSSKITLEEIELSHHRKDEILTTIKESIKSLKEVLELNGSFNPSFQKLNSNKVESSLNQ